MWILKVSLRAVHLLHKSWVHFLEKFTRVYETMSRVINSKRFQELRIYLKYKSSCDTSFSKRQNLTIRFRVNNTMQYNIVFQTNLTWERNYLVLQVCCLIIASYIKRKVKYFSRSLSQLECEIRDRRTKQHDIPQKLF